MMKRSFLLALLFCSGQVLSQSPGGVEGIIARLQAGSKKNNAQLSNSPAGITGNKIYPPISLLNYNPVFQFDGTDHPISVPVQLDELAQATIFVVYQAGGPDLEQNIWKANGHSRSFQLTTKKIDDFPGSIPYINTKFNSAVINTYIRRWKNDKVEIPLQQSISLGQNLNDSSSFKGKIAEFIVYNKVLKAAEQRKVESYLAIKYGISLEHDYISSSGKIIWSTKKNSAYNNRITGIGRDDDGDLYQKQSQHRTDSFMIAMGAGKITNSNSGNSSQINDDDFLLFGDDDGELVLGNNEDLNVPCRELKRRWIMNVSGISAHSLSTELRIDISKIFAEKYSPDKYLLIIDRNGNGYLSQSKREYFVADEISDEGILSFKNIYWDTDKSGRDNFTLGVRSDVRSLLTETLASQDGEEFLLYPNPSSNGNYTLSISLKVQSPVHIDIFNESGQLIQSLSGDNQRRYFFNNRLRGAAGVYTFQIRTSYKKTTRQLIVR